MKTLDSIMKRFYHLFQKSDEPTRCEKAKEQHEKIMDKYTRRAVVVFMVLILAAIFVTGWTLQVEIRRIHGKIAQPATAPSPLTFVSDDEARRLDGRLVAEQKGNIMYFRALTPPKPPSEERFRVPIADGMSNIIAAVRSTTAAMGPNYTPLAIVPEIGVYEGKLALMGAIVTIAFPPQK